MQDVWERKLGWDEDLPKEILNKWEELCSIADDMQQIKFPRMTCREKTNYYLHVTQDSTR